MSDIVFITGNQNKADYLAKWLGMPIAHQKVSVDELQSLDLAEVVEHKARGAYQLIQKPVLVEDIALTLHGMGRLPGPLVKWFLEELGTEGLCRLARSFDDKTATVSIMYGLYDGTKLHTFEAHVPGTIADEPRGEHGFGFAPIFIPEGTDKTTAEMTDDELKPFSHRAKAIEKLKEFLQGQ